MLGTGTNDAKHGTPMAFVAEAYVLAASPARTGWDEDVCSYECVLMHERAHREHDDI